MKRNEVVYGVPLEVVSYKQLYGWTMDEIVAQIGTRNNCTFCGVFRRQVRREGAWCRGAAGLGASLGAWCSGAAGLGVGPGAW